MTLPPLPGAPRHIVGLSGGKDSTALALWLVENEPRPYEFICNFTGNETPEMVEHWAKLEGLLGSKLIPVTHSADLVQLCEQMNMLPNFRQRWCTRILKIEPTIAFMESLPDSSVLYVGLRADEESRPGIYGEDLTIRFPLREQGFTEAMVLDYLCKRGVTIPDRTDCMLCPYQRLGEWHYTWLHLPEHYAEGVRLEAKTGHTFRSPGRDTWPASLAELAKEFERGRPIRKSKRDTTCRVCSL